MVVHASPAVASFAPTALHDRAQAKQHTTAGKQDWPSVPKWARGSNFAKERRMPNVTAL